MTLRILAAALIAAGPALAEPTVPDFAAADFTAPAENPYFPLAPGDPRVLAAEGVDADGERFTERFEQTNIGPGPVLLGVQTMIQRDRAFEDGVLVEETLDYYAADSAGNVWYFGEDVVNYVYDGSGALVGTNAHSSWRSGVDGAMPGWMMPADPVVGLEYYQEIAKANDALDQARIHALGTSVGIDGIGRLDDVLVTYETSALDPDLREFKYYAPGIGLIRADEGLSPALDDPALIFTPRPGAAN
jgi:hypothetical protein